MTLAVVALFSDLSEAQVACAALQSAGLAAVVLDDPFTPMAPIEAALPDGLRLCVPERELEAAEAVLAAARDAGAAGDGA